MKARVKETGVLTDVIPKTNINAQHSGDNLYVCDNMVFRECELDFLNVGNLVIDWEQRRYELAKAALRDDTDDSQWFTDGEDWFLCQYLKVGMHYQDKPEILFDKWHKASVDELIEHFKQ